MRKVAECRIDERFAVTPSPSRRVIGAVDLHADVTCAAAPPGGLTIRLTGLSGEQIQQVLGLVADLKNGGDAEVVEELRKYGKAVQSSK